MLVAAERKGPVRLSALAGFTGLNPTMLSRLVPKLEEAQLLRRLGDDTDRRVSLVEVTARGSRLLDKVRSERNDLLSRRVAGLSEEDRQRLVAAIPVLEGLAEALLEEELVRASR